MPRTANVEKPIACLETLGDRDVEDRWTMSPILDVVAKTYYVRTSQLTCNTEAELRCNLKLLPARRKSCVQYFAFHGKTGRISLHDGTDLALGDLAQMLGSKFKNWVVHFGSCSTLGADEDTLERFLDQTGCMSVTGYTRTVDWIDAAAMDLIVLSYLQEYKDMGAMVKKIRRDYACLVERLGFSAYFWDQENESRS